MLVDLTPEQFGTLEGAGALPEWISRDRDGFSVRGDDSLERETYLHVGEDRVVVATDMPTVVDEVRRSLDAVAVAPEGVSHMLGTGFTPLPLTVYANVLRIGAGDVARVSFPSGTAACAVDEDYPWLRAKSRQDQKPSTERLYELIVTSLQRRLDKCGRNGVLMLSSGKDSVTLAIALADLGYDIPCVTYRAEEANTEHEYAAAFCRRLGLRHRTIEMPTDPGRVRSHLLSFFEKAVAPSADHAMIPFIVTIAETGIESGGIIDGGGNDGYMGYLPSSRRRKKRTFRIRGRWAQEMVARATPIDSRVNYLARSRSGAAWPGRNLRHHEMRPLFADAIDPAERWRREDRKLRGWADIDRAQANMLRQIEGSRTPDKVRLVAQTREMEAVLPYCDQELADYCFNLPVDQRYNESTRTDKILLRQLLKERIDYDAESVGESFFAFAGASFFTANADLVRDEIHSCSLWEPEVRAVVDGWLEALPRRPFLFHALLNLFVVSGWHNHSPYLSDRQP
ncbi:MAG: asparagine synthase-related protein [Acidimicrobiia bacterium]|nr:asparagine synthase-related protein [Acidimicrobiia bacterium]